MTLGSRYQELKAIFVAASLIAALPLAQEGCFASNRSQTQTIDRVMAGLLSSERFLVAKPQVNLAQVLLYSENSA